MLRKKAYYIGGSAREGGALGWVKVHASQKEICPGGGGDNCSTPLTAWRKGKKENNNTEEGKKEGKDFHEKEGKASISS